MIPAGRIGWTDRACQPEVVPQPGDHKSGTELTSGGSARGDQAACASPTPPDVNRSLNPAPTRVWVTTAAWLDHHTARGCQNNSPCPTTMTGRRGRRGRRGDSATTGGCPGPGATVLCAGNATGPVGTSEPGSVGPAGVI